MKSLYMASIRILWAAGVLQPFLQAVVQMLGEHYVETKVLMSKRVNGNSSDEAIASLTRLYTLQWNKVVEESISKALKGEGVDA